MKNWTIIYIISDRCTRRKYIQHANFFYISIIYAAKVWPWFLIQLWMVFSFSSDFSYRFQVFPFLFFFSSYLPPSCSFRFFICAMLVGFLDNPVTLLELQLGNFYTAICSSFSCRSATGFLFLSLKPISLSKVRFSATPLCCFSCDALLLAALWLLFLAAGTSWLCFPSYVVITALGSVEALSTCFRTLQPTLVHL